MSAEHRHDDCVQCLRRDVADLRKERDELAAQLAEMASMANPPLPANRTPWKNLGDCVAGINKACEQLADNLHGLGAEGLTKASVTIHPKAYGQLESLATSGLGLTVIKFLSNRGQIVFRPGDPE